ncbi:hypothetical protein MLD38_013464 [Melastoma candidum]|nr:hypothetical protein MLD38_013464 [Melastoma candidum]
MTAAFDGTMLGFACRPKSTDPGDHCEYTKLTDSFSSIEQTAINNREKVILLKLVKYTDNTVACYLTAKCHDGVQDCPSCFQAAYDEMAACAGYVGAQVILKDCELKYDKYGEV